MDLRFECLDATNKRHAFRVELDGRSVTLFRLRGTAPDGSDRWETWGYYTDLPNAVVGLARRGLGTFPGSLTEVLATLERLGDDIRRVLRPFERTGASIDELRTAALKVDSALSAAVVSEPARAKTEPEPEVSFDDL